ncbi:divergent PAP2 family protein [Acidaminobacterium chupaoyuni]
MKNFFETLVSNQILNVAVVCWFSAQALKVVGELIRHHKLDLGLFFAGGGMPSSHTSTVVGLTTAVLYRCGFSSTEFAVCMVLTSIVLFDALNVRLESGKHAAALNEIVENLSDSEPTSFYQKFKTPLGHTFPEVLTGMILGIAIAVLMCN